MGLYSKNGMLNGYSKNHKERQAEDYYATPTIEVENILNTLNYDFSNKSILEPCVGGGHMMEGILHYAEDMNNIEYFASDFKDRGYNHENINFKYNIDFLDDNYPFNKVDIIIMNPPYSTLEPFLIRALEIAQEKLIVLCRMQVIEGTGRYKNIFKDNPPSYIYQYIERIQCWKNGTPPTGSSSQGYCWLIWDKTEQPHEPVLRWIHRV